MAKMTIDNVTYEGTPEELREIVRTFEVAEDVEPAVASKLAEGDRVRIAGESIYGRNKDGEIGTFEVTTVNCAQCNADITPEDVVYDDRRACYYCDMPCFRDWADDNSELVTDFYVRLNITE